MHIPKLVFDGVELGDDYAVEKSNEKYSEC